MARNGGLWSFRSGPRNHRYSLVGRHDADGSADDARFCATRMSFLTARLPRPTDATRTPFPSSAPALAGNWRELAPPGIAKVASTKPPAATSWYSSAQP